MVATRDDVNHRSIDDNDERLRMMEDTTMGGGERKNKGGRKEVTCGGERRSGTGHGVLWRS